MNSLIPRFISISFGTSFRDDLSQLVHLYAQCLVEPPPQLTPEMTGIVRMGNPNDRTMEGDEGLKSPRTKFEVEVSDRGGGELVHIRSCHNNKYLHRLPNSHFLAAASESRQDDPTGSSSTLFRLLPQSPPSDPLRCRLTLLCDGTERNVVHGTASNSDPIMYLAAMAGVGGNIYGLVDLGALASVPPVVVIKGDNGRWLRNVGASNAAGSAVQFASENEEDRRTHFEVVTRRDGTVLIKSRFMDQHNYLVAVGTGFMAPTFNVVGQALNGLLYPLRVSRGGDPNVIAFRRVNNGRYLRRSSAGNIIDGLSADASSIGAQCRLTVTPAVRDRQVYDVKFMQPKIYDLIPVKTMSKVVVNGSPDASQEAELSFRYEEHEKEEWSTSLSWQVGFNYSVTISARIPVIKFIGAEATAELDVGYQGQRNWGKEVERTTEVETIFRVTVPPNTRSRVIMVVSDSKMDVPFSYTQRDTLLDWETSVSKQEDGHFETESTHIDFEVMDEPLDTDEAVAT